MLVKLETNCRAQISRPVSAELSSFYSSFQLGFQKYWEGCSSSHRQAECSTDLTLLESKPIAQKWCGMLQPRTDDNLAEQIELGERVKTKSRSGGGDKPFKILEIERNFENEVWPDRWLPCQYTFCSSKGPSESMEARFVTYLGSELSICLLKHFHRADMLLIKSGEIHGVVALRESVLTVSHHWRRP